MSESLFPLIYVFGAAMITMGLGFQVQRFTRNASFVDILWAMGVGFSAFFLSHQYSGNQNRSLLAACLCFVWALRLSAHLARRLWKKPEDARYLEMRRKSKAKADLYFFILFQAQALFIVIFSAPFIATFRNEAPFPSVYDLFAICIWLISICGESLADSQLKRFLSRKENQGKVCKEGFWRYSRHPNYFFEWLHWWTYVFFAVGSDLWFVSLLGPAAMLLFLYKITGIPILEKRSLENRGDSYRQYMRETNRFFPWFPNLEEKK